MTGNDDVAKLRRELDAQRTRLNKLDSAAAAWIMPAFVGGIAGAALSYGVMTYVAPQETPDFSTFALKSDLPDVSALASAEDIPDTSTFVTTDSLPDVSGFLTADDLPDMSAYLTADDLPAPIDTSEMVTDAMLEEAVRGVLRDGVSVRLEAGPGAGAYLIGNTADGNVVSLSEDTESGTSVWRLVVTEE